MNINRHNYEEFFLLYVDNELSAVERNAVELFVQNNADLKAELNLLQQTVYKADATVFENKEALLKDEFAALQQNLLCYIDDELNTADKLIVEKLLKSDSNAATELALLQQTKLQPDTAIVFAHKNLLYKKEGGKVIGLPWRRIAAAAILLGFGTWAMVAALNKKEDEIIAITTNTPAVTAPPDNTTINPALEAPQKSIAEIVPEKNDVITATSSPKKNVPENSVQQKENSIATVKENKKPDNNLPKPDYEKINTPRSNQNVIASVTPVITATDKINSGNKTPVVVNSNSAIDEPVNGYALTTNFAQSEDEENFTTADKKKTRLGGFFRKVKRVVERNTNIKTGNGIMVAGFDIAIK